MRSNQLSYIAKETRIIMMMAWFVKYRVSGSLKAEKSPFPFEIKKFFLRSDEKVCYSSSLGRNAKNFLCPLKIAQSQAIP
ncbi:hypothetical protein [Alysiella filiformis]|uniref:hypothetical protein n=1 Tax=Alysiella filiformis TaxID=194196 RepID=UPI00117780C2|nr:hypothetical protein [Alysiella filiformis]UBQ57258.1 hypothetical protein JF568_05840 [Alysiella filiformis DSM 16848]